MEKISKRVSAIEEVNNNVKLLTEMVTNHSQGGASAHSSEDLMKVCPLLPPRPRPQVSAGLTHPPCCPQELYQRCERMRPTLFRLASDTEDNDEALGEPWALSPLRLLPLPLPGHAKYLQLAGATSRGPPSPALILGFCMLRGRLGGSVV